MSTSPVRPSAPNFEIAGVLLDALATRNFARLAAAFDADAAMSALLPRGFCEFQGAAAILGEFERWFGDAHEFEVADASVGQVGALLQLRWRVRVTATRFGDDPMVVEQNVYAVTSPAGRISHMSVLCSGFWNEHLDA